MKMLVLVLAFLAIDAQDEVVWKEMMIGPVEAAADCQENVELINKTALNAGHRIVYLIKCRPVEIGKGS